MSAWNTFRFAVATAALGAIARGAPEIALARRRSRWRRLLRHAATRVPLYREKFRGIDLERATPTDVPPTTKAEMMDDFERAVADRAVRREELERFMADEGNLGRYYLGKYAVSHTSGSQGRPSLLLQDRAALRTLFAILSSRGNAAGAPGVCEGLKRLREPARLAVISLRRGFFPSGAAFEFMPEYAGPFLRLLRLSSLDPDLAAKLNEFRPTAVSAYASVLDALALRSGELRLNPWLRQLGTTGERLTEAARARLERVFGVPIFDHYGCGECLFLGEGCPTHGGVHVNADWAIVEVVDARGRPTAPGELGERVYITNLANRVQPIVRYELGDRVAWADEPCSCGNRLPRLSRIEGRSADVMWVHAERGWQALTGVVFADAVDGLPGLREWQAVQRDRGRVELRLEPLPGATLDPTLARRAIVERTRAAGLTATLAIDVTVVPALRPDERTGKFRRLVVLPPPSDPLVRESRDRLAS